MASANPPLISSSGDNAVVNILGGTYTQLNQNVVTNSRGFDLLVQNVAPKARHDAGEVADPTKCHPDTRVAILADLEEWAEATTYNYPIKWVRGSAGVGKTTIMRTIAEALTKRELLLSSFFFWRTGDRCNNAEFLIATLAYQISISIPGSRQHIEGAIEKDPLIFTRALEVQSRELIVNPLTCTNLPKNYPRIFVIDAIDECSSRQAEKQVEVLGVLHWTIKQLPSPFAVLVASRPEIHIQGVFNTSLKDASSTLIIDDSLDASADIERFYADKFREIREHHPMKSYIPTQPEWPLRTVIDYLVEMASGQFIYASTVIRFVAATHKNPCRQLAIILDAKIRGKAKPFQPLDVLYSTIFSTLDDIELSGTLHVLGALLVPLNSSFMRLPSISWDSLLGLTRGEVRRLLLGLESLLSVGEPDTEVTLEPTILFTHEWIQVLQALPGTIRFYHKSLADFLFDSTRSGPFFIDQDMAFEDLAKQCILHLFTTDVITLCFVFFNLNKIIELAKPTKELFHAINQGTQSLTQWQRSPTKKNFSSIALFHLASVCLVFLEAIKKSGFQKVQCNSLFTSQRSIFESAMNRALLPYFREGSLRFLLLTSLVYPRDKFSKSFCDFINHVWPLSEKLERIDKEDGFFLYRNTPPSLNAWGNTWGAFEEVLWRLVAKEREEKTWFAKAASRLVRCMCPSSGFYITSNLEMGSPPRMHTIGDSVAYVLPELLSRASTRSNLGQYLRHNPISEEYLEIPGIQDAIDEYLSEEERTSRFVERIRAWISNTSQNLKRGRRKVTP